MARTAIRKDMMDSLKEIPGANGNFFQEMVELFGKQYLEYSAALDRHFKDERLDEVARCVHQLKSSSGNLGAIDFSQFCGELEAAALAGNMPLAKTLYAEFVQDYAAVLEALRRLAA